MGMVAKVLGLVGLAGLALFALLLLALYLRGAFGRRVTYHITDAPSTKDARFPHILEGLSGSLDTSGSPTDFWLEADAICEARLAAVRSAAETIQFETFYMTPGRRADAFASALIERARAGVRVQCLVDHNGSKQLEASYWDRLREAGVEVRFFRCFSWRSPLDYLSRTHRKLLLIDGRSALIGGAGISDDWDGKPEIGDGAPWRDFEVRFEGHVVGVLAGIFMQDWSAAGGQLDLGQDIFREARRTEGPLVYITTGSFSIESSPMKLLFHVSIHAARQRVWIASPYFLPEPSTRHAMLEACRRGVDVRVLTMGPANDRPPVYWTAREAYAELIDGGIQIYEYRPSMMHAKAILVDDDWMSTGSANFDPLSFFHNNELNISNSDGVLGEHLDRFFEDSFAKSDLVTIEAWRRRPLRDRVVGKALESLRMVF